MSPQQIQKFQKHILNWYAKNKRDLPWRQTRDPYKILVSEIMSQQTQVSRVVPKYEAWLRAFPTVQDLAKASTRDVLLHWSGLGYNRRALYLQKCAQELVKRYSVISKDKVLRDPMGISHFVRNDIVWPQTEQELMKLPGIGKYTARALLCFAFDQQIAVVDTNVKKVILTQLLFPKFSEKQRSIKYNVLSIKEKNREKEIHNTKYVIHDTFSGNKLTDRELEQIAQQLLPKGRAYDWNQALMDYSSAELKKEKIPIPKQSHFLTSDRYYRGQVIKLLLKQHMMTIADVEASFPAQQKIELSRLQKILQQLEKDMLIQINNEKISLANS